MKTLNGIIVGLIIGGILAGWVGYNLGRDAPVFSNPFVERSLTDRLNDKASELYKDTREAINH